MTLRRGLAGAPSGPGARTRSTPGCRSRRVVLAGVRRRPRRPVPGAARHARCAAPSWAPRSRRSPACAVTRRSASAIAGMARLDARSRRGRARHAWSARGPDRAGHGARLRRSGLAARWWLPLVARPAPRPPAGARSSRSCSPRPTRSSGAASTTCSAGSSTSAIARRPASCSSLACAWLAAGLLIGRRDGHPGRRARRRSAPRPGRPRSIRRGIGSARRRRSSSWSSSTSSSALFVGLQVAYLFGGQSTLVAAGMTYSDYARRGFFELVAAACLAGGVVVALETTVARRSRPYLAALLALIGLTAVVLVSAALRLRLYQDAYGWTELRLYVLTTIAALAVHARPSWSARRSPAGCAGWGTAWRSSGSSRWSALNLVAPAAFVAARNVERIIDPSLVPPGGHAASTRPTSASCRTTRSRSSSRRCRALPEAERRAVRRLLDERAARARDGSGVDRARPPGTSGASGRGRPWRRCRDARRRPADGGTRVGGHGTPLRPARSNRCSPRPSDGLPTDDGWLFEPKWDGFRALVFRDGDEVYTQSRDLKPLDRYFPELADPLRAALPERCVLDGEVVIAARRGARLRGAAAAHPPGRVAGEDARRGVAGLVRRLGPARARRRGPAGGAAGRAAGAPRGASSAASSRRST